MLPLSYPKFYVFRSISSLLLLFHWSLLSLLQTILFKVALKYTFGEGNGTPLQYSFLEKSHGWRSLVGCSPWGCKQLDTTERLHFHFSLSCIGEGNGNPLQCSCLENPRDGGAWWAAVYGVAQSRTRLKLLSRSSSRNNIVLMLNPHQWTVLWRIFP